MLCTIIGHPFSIKTKSDDVPTHDKHLLQQCIAAGGSAVYNQLVACLREYDDLGHPDLLKILTDHQVRQLYRYVWIWQDDQTVISRGRAWFTSEQDCRDEGLKHNPRLHNPSSSGTTLSVESCCPCYLHDVDQGNYTVMDRPCRCFVDDQCHLFMPDHTPAFTRHPLRSTNVINAPKKHVTTRPPLRRTPARKAPRKRLF